MGYTYLSTYPCMCILHMLLDACCAIGLILCICLRVCVRELACMYVCVHLFNCKFISTNGMRMSTYCCARMYVWECARACTRSHLGACVCVRACVCAHVCSREYVRVVRCMYVHGYVSAKFYIIIMFNLWYLRNTFWPIYPTVFAIDFILQEMRLWNFPWSLGKRIRSPNVKTLFHLQDESLFAFWSFRPWVNSLTVESFIHPASPHSNSRNRGEFPLRSPGYKEHDGITLSRR